MPRPTMPCSAQARSLSQRGPSHHPQAVGRVSGPRQRPTLDAVDGGLLAVAVPAVDVVKGDAVVELGLLLVAEVAQAIPLAGDLGVEGPDVVVDDARGLGEEVLVEELALEEARLLALGIEGPVERDPGGLSVS